MSAGVTIKHKRKAGAFLGGELSAGELGINTSGGELYFSADGSTVSQPISGTLISHTHGNITNSGAIGATANLPLITTTSGVVTTGAFGTGATNFCAGNDSRLSNARTPTAHTHSSTDVTGFATEVDSRIEAAVIGDLSNVTETSIMTGDVLRWNGSAWVNYADSQYAGENHDHSGVYEPADATILKDADIGVNVQAYNAGTLISGGALGTPSGGNLTNCTFPTLNQNTTGTAAGLSTALAVASGGTGATTLASAGIAQLTELASTTNAKGASLIGIEDAGTLFTATDVEGALAEVKAIADAAGGGGGGTETKFSVTQVAHGLAVNNVIYNNAGTYEKAKADDPDTAEVIGIVSAVDDADNFTISTGGLCETLSGLTANQLYFLSGVTAGLLTTTDPADVGSVGSVSKPILTTISTTAGVIHNYRGMVVGGAAETPGCVKLATATASSDATIDFTDSAFFDGTYSRLQLVGANLAPSTDAVTALLRISISTVWQTSNYTSSSHYTYPAGNSHHSNLTSGIFVATAGAAAGENGSTIIDIIAPSNSGSYKSIFGQSMQEDSASNNLSWRFSGRYEGGTGAFDGIRFQFSAGNVASGEFTLYGYK